MTRQTQVQSTEEAPARSALKLALEALELFCWKPSEEDFDCRNNAITALREALAQELRSDEQPAQHQCKFPLCHSEEYQQAIAEQIKRELYTGEPAQRQARSANTWVNAATWRGLTRAECLQIEKDMMKYYDSQHECKTVCLPEFARAIEAKLKAKNSL